MSSTLTFVLLAAALVVVALLFVLPVLLRSRGGPQASRAALNADIYRQELDELQAEVDRGAIAPDEAARAREELQRRLLEEARDESAGAPLIGRRHAAVAVAVLLPALAVALYFAVGTPGALEEAEAPPVGAEADYVARLESHLKRQPRDARAWVLLAREQAERNDFHAAAASYEKALAVPPGKVAKDPNVLCEYADVLGMTQGGRLTGKPMEYVMQALAIDPQHRMALEMAGSEAYAAGRYAESAKHWRALLEQLPPGSEQHAQLAAAVERAQRRAGVSLPPR